MFVAVDKNINCPNPERQINNGILDKTNLNTYKEGDKVQYNCNEGFHFKNESQAICTAGEWNYPECIQRE